MDNLISILIADDNIEFGNILREFLDNYGGLIVKGVARDGLEAIGMLKEHAPDVVILDLIMPNLDGIGVLERIQSFQLKSKPIFIVLTAVGQDGFIQKAVQLGADYYMVKPFDVEMLVKRINQLYNERYARREINMGMAEAGSMHSSQYMENRIEMVVTGQIRIMGILPNIAGFHYLREAVVLAVEDPNILASVTRNVYPVIAGRHNITESQVNRAIRRAIQTSMDKRYKIEDKKAISTFGHFRKNMTNAGIISSLAGKARLLLNK
jgi:two-component system response regulator (stage 0 sporulation protein A)